MSLSAYQVPMLLWANQRFRQANADWWSRAQARAGTALTFDNRVFEATAQDILGYESAYPSLAGTAAAPALRIQGEPLNKLFQRSACSPH
jgi:hypothetical protein